MLASFSEFKFYQSFRIPVEKADNLRFLVEKETFVGKNQYIEDAVLLDISITGLGFRTQERISVGTELIISLQFKKHHLDLNGRVVRAFCDTIDNNDIIYGVEIDEEPKIAKFLHQFVLSFSSERLKECLIDAALRDRYTKLSDGFEMFSLLLSLFKDITYFGDKDGFIENMLEEVVRVMNATRSSLFLINPETNELKAVAALGQDKDRLKFDYRLGIPGLVFTTGVALNIDTVSDRTRFNDFFDKANDFETKSVICHPIHNREDKIIGVIEVINKRNEDRFTIEDEKIMKVLSLVFSSVFHKYNPISDSSKIRRFSGPRDRQYALIGKTPHMGSLRSSILKLKDLEEPMLITGEQGVGKVLFARILHAEGQRGLKGLEIVDCNSKNIDSLSRQLWGEREECKLIKCQGGSLVLREISSLSMGHQEYLLDILKKRKIPNIPEMNLDIRLIATSSRDLGEMVDKGTFHRELYELISKAVIYMEPLRRRVEDIELLAEYFLKIECKREGLLLKEFSRKMIEKMKDYDWPQNVKELKTMVQRAVLYNPKAHTLSEVDFESTASPLVDKSARARRFGDLPFVSDFHIPLKDRVAIVEREMINGEIKRCNGNKSKAAKEMGISREALRKKLLFSGKILGELESGQSHKKKKAA